MQLQKYLDTISNDPSLKAKVWAALHAADPQRALDATGLPKEIKKRLWNIQFGNPSSEDIVPSSYQPYQSYEAYQPPTSRSTPSQMPLSSRQADGGYLPYHQPPYQPSSVPQELTSCVECDRCNQAPIMVLVNPFITLFWFLFAWNIGLFFPRCRRCKHLMMFHEKR